MHVGGIFFDLVKVFDCVNLEIFLVNLHYYGIQGMVNNWFRSNLTNRKQKTEMKSLQKFSLKRGTAKYEVFQESVLGPLLFIIYINNLPTAINTLLEPILFTDDTTVIISSKNFDDFSTVSDTVLSHMSKWFTSNKLVLSLDKTNIIKFITPHHSMI
jgi:hypothetical protein